MTAKTFAELTGETPDPLEGYELVETFMPYYSSSKEMDLAIVGYDMEYDPTGVFLYASPDREFIIKWEPSGHERDSSMDFCHLYRKTNGS